MQQPLISIVVPVYNTEAYLVRCVESVLRQTYQNWELLLIDDGSTDRSTEICDSYAEQDQRIRVFHQSNRGLSAARNLGMLHKNGEYLTFLDSDDCLADCALERMFSVLISAKVDVVVCGYVRFSENTELTKLSIQNESLEYEVFDNLSFLRKIILDEKRYQMACAKLYNSNILTAQFPVGKCHEDEYWTYQIIDQASKIAEINNPLYFYYVRAGSITQARFSLRRLDGFFALRERHAYLSKNQPSLAVLSAKSLFGACMYHYQMLLAHKEVDPNGEWRTMIKGEMRALPYDKWKKFLPLKQRIWQSSFRLLPGVIGRVRNFFKIGW